MDQVYHSFLGSGSSQSFSFVRLGVLPGVDIDIISFFLSFSDLIGHLRQYRRRLGDVMAKDNATSTGSIVIFIVDITNEGEMTRN